MKKCALLQFFTFFEKHDYKRFRKYLRSPFFNSNVLLEEIFMWIFKYKEEFLTPDFSLEPIIDDFIKKKLIKLKTAKVLSELYKHAEGYLLYTLQEKDNFNKMILLLKFFLNKNDFINFEFHYKKAKYFLGNEAEKDGVYYLNRFKVIELYDEYITIKNNRGTNDSFVEKIEVLDKNYWIQKLKLIIYQINKAKILNIETNEDILDEAILKVNEFKKTDEPYLLIYSEMVLLSQSKDKEIYYNKLLKLSIQYKDKIKKEDLRSVYILLSNSLIRIFSGKKVYSELFILNKEKIKIGLHKVNNETIPAEFNNIITCALGIDEYDWVKKFIEVDGKLLPKVIRKDYILYNQARCAFYCSAFDECISLLAFCKPTDVIFKTKLKRLYLKASFELKDYGLYDSISHSFKMFLYRDKELTKKNNKANTSFLSFTNKLFKINLVNDYNNKNKLDKLKIQVESKKFPDRAWLMEKLKEAIM